MFLASIVLWLSAAVCSGMIWYGSRRGFDFSDEGCAFLAMADPSNFRGTYKCDHFYNAFLWRLTGQSIPRFRILVWLVNSLAAVFFGWALLALLQFQYSDRPIGPLEMADVLVFCYVASFTRYLFTREVFNYNMYVSLTATVYTGCIFLYAVPNSLGPTLAAVFGAGVCCGLAATVKITSGGSMMGAAAIAIVLLGPTEIVTKVYALTALGAGFACWFALYHVFVQRLQDWLAGMKEFLALVGGAGVPLGDMVWIFLRDVGYFFKPIFRRWAVVSILALALLEAGRYFLPRLLSPAMAASLFDATIIVTIIRVIFRRRLYQCVFWRSIFNCSRVSYLALVGFAFLCLGLAALEAATLTDFIQNLVAHWPAIVLVGLLGSLPIIVTFGTDNPIFYITNFELICPWAGMLLLATLADNMVPWPVNTGFVFVLGGGITAIQFYQSFIREPYRTANLRQQTITAPMGSGRQPVLLDPKTAELINSLRPLLDERHFRNGDDVLGYSGMPGLVFAVGGVSPGLPILQPTTVRGGDFLPAALAYLMTNPPERILRCWLFVEPGSPGAERFVESIVKAGIRLPGTHVKCGQFYNPWSEQAVEIWQPLAPRT